MSSGKCYLCFEIKNDVGKPGKDIINKIKLCFPTQVADSKDVLLCQDCKFQLSMVSEIRQYVDKFECGKTEHNICFLCGKQTWMFNVIRDPRNTNLLTMISKCSNKSNIKANALDRVCYKCVYFTEVWHHMLMLYLRKTGKEVHINPDKKSTQDSQTKDRSKLSNKKKTTLTSEMKKLTMDICNANAFSSKKTKLRDRRFIQKPLGKERFLKELKTSEISPKRKLNDTKRDVLLKKIKYTSASYSPQNTACNYISNKNIQVDKYILEDNKMINATCLVYLDEAPDHLKKRKNTNSMRLGSRSLSLRKRLSTKNTFLISKYKKDLFEDHISKTESGEDVEKSNKSREKVLDDHTAVNITRNDILEKMNNDVKNIKDNMELEQCIVTNSENSKSKKETKYRLNTENIASKNSELHTDNIINQDNGSIENISQKCLQHIHIDDKNNKRTSNEAMNGNKSFSESVKTKKMSEYREDENKGLSDYTEDNLNKRLNVVQIVENLKEIIEEDNTKTNVSKSNNENDSSKTNLVRKTHKLSFNDSHKSIDVKKDESNARTSLSEELLDLNNKSLNKDNEKEIISCSNETVKISNENHSSEINIFDSNNDQNNVPVEQYEVKKNVCHIDNDKQSLSLTKEIEEKHIEIQTLENKSVENKMTLEESLQDSIVNDKFHVVATMLEKLGA